MEFNAFHLQEPALFLSSAASPSATGFMQMERLYKIGITVPYPSGWFPFRACGAE
jgi:hypothetical protein